MEQWKTIRTVGINQIKLLASNGAGLGLLSVRNG